MADSTATGNSPTLYSQRVSFNQAEFGVRCEWGLRGLRDLAPISDVVIIVDVLSFSTALDLGTSRGGIIFPYPLKGDSATAYAASLNAQLASVSRGVGLSLSPTSLRSMEAGCRLVLPSPNGAALSFSADHRNVLAACLRNATAAAALAARLGSTIAVIPAGETWDTGDLRPSLEDLVGAGAVIASLPGKKSPDAQLAAAGFEYFRKTLPQTLRHCGSGKELIERGFAPDVELAAEFNVSSNVPCLRDRAFAGVLAY
jgi:2-phosphosulfolactate phosphatase